MAKVIPIDTNDAELIGFALNRARLMESGAIPFKSAMDISFGRITFKKIGDEVRAYVKDLIVPAKTQKTKNCSWKKEQPFDFPVLPDINFTEEAVNTLMGVPLNFNPTTGLYMKVRFSGTVSGGYRARTSSIQGNCGAVLLITTETYSHGENTYAITDKVGGYYSITTKSEYTKDTKFTVKQRLRTKDGSDLFRSYELPGAHTKEITENYAEAYAGDPDGSREATNSLISNYEYATLAVAPFVDGEENLYIVLSTTRQTATATSGTSEWMPVPPINTYMTTSEIIMYKNGTPTGGYTPEFFSALPLFFPFFETEKESIDGMLVPATLIENSSGYLCVKDGLFFVDSEQVRFIAADNPTVVLNVMPLPEIDLDIAPAKRYQPYLFYSDGKKSVFLSANSRIAQLKPSKIIANSFSPNWINYSVKLENDED